MPLPIVYEPHFLCFDAHYYFANFDSIYYDYLPEPLFSASVHTTGGNFHPVPGRYLLPQREGTFEIYPKADTPELWVRMNTKGGSQTYDHPLITYLNPCHEVASGWYTWFRDVIPLSRWSTRLHVHRFKSDALFDHTMIFSN